VEGAIFGLQGAISECARCHFRCALSMRHIAKSHRCSLRQLSCPPVLSFSAPEVSSVTVKYVARCQHHSVRNASPSVCP
jgi:hypothetical protein